MSAGLLIATTAEFEHAVSRPGLVLADFVGPNCTICRNIAPMLASLARSREGRLDLIEVDAASLDDLAERFTIRSLPTLILFSGGEAIARRTGFATATELGRWVDENAAAPQS
jgi:thioredoxin-like negative regulator of GroEL